ncbi:hypothetical protein PHYBLDRAFT_148786 [Phycomyces blakesleeanus NRRL 1555(-)]|uniref:Uncharacterized protein n=1 Tax=Phycomyces blakesleeanus (strain ATCC 8743b / DSM 1359 / FGSC 10004 / NBRC 33097 / NRRL 1555) TaxID=763407 RepID=A0A167LDX4_PHYB8|nr:hypothetical protein PHYBLDRAFT_148786 [Phycomyces blakesleeanus NRRL 1555(-)]OAD70238.1 hypothetical protein PHYBLDRAFT_148786 [Phycomyces blakesleeanus NRRL 1555(-)]|eukprot:XP_018288278.1 hypothetical protein PHYBLDRAFT_148786 [Phycomyces blakesleeanus NRRL 1555(-)]
MGLELSSTFAGSMQHRRQTVMETKGGHIDGIDFATTFKQHFTGEESLCVPPI